MILTKKHSADSRFKALAIGKSLGVMLSTQVFIGLLLTSFISTAQEQDYKEGILIDINSNQHLVGETIHFTVFAVSETTGKPSPLSNYAYVQLVGREGVIAQQKLELTASVGSGEFFIPSKLITGKYYLLAYTRWMRNFENYTKAPLNIINPYLPYDDVLNAVGNNRQVAFKPLSGQMTVGMKNRIAFRITDEKGLGVQDKGRLVDSNGALIAEVSTNTNGLGTFEFTPKENTKYQMVLTDTNDDFLFFGLPAVSTEGVGIHVTHTEQAVEILLNDPSKPILGRLTIERNGKIVMEESLTANTSPLKINRADLPADILTLTVWNDANKKTAHYDLINNWVKQEAGLGELNKRQEVSFLQSLEKGTYNISVRKTSELESNNHFTDQANYLPHLKDSPTLDFGYLEARMAFYKNPGVEPKNFEINYLPETKSELIEGRIVNGSGQPAVKKTVMLTLDNGSYNISSDQTDENGTFLIPYKSPYTETLECHVTVYDFKEEYYIQLKDNFLVDLPELDFSPIRLDSTLIPEILERSINSQLDNAYFVPQVDNSASNIPPILSQTDFSSSYNFDDYTRFKTVEEHFIEYIAGARVRKAQESTFIVSTPYLELNFYNTPLILLDGVPVDANAILEFSPYRIQQVDLLNTLFLLQDTPFDGVVNFTTIEGDLGGFKSLKNTLTLDLAGTKPINELDNFKPTVNARIPDQRIQLLWKPAFRVANSSEQTITFMTSDISGEFQVSIEGITENGLPVSITRKLSVKEDNYEK